MESVHLFQFLFIEDEMRNFVEYVIKWAEAVAKSGTSLLFLKNCLFKYTFRFDYQKLLYFSESLSTSFYNDLATFKTNLLHIIYRLVKRISAEILDNKCFYIDMQQIKIAIEPTSLPFDLGFLNKDGIIDYGDHSLVSGVVVDISDKKSIIIRYLYCCHNLECKHKFYIKSRSNYGRIHCRRCGELAEEDETGRILINTKIIQLYPKGTFGFHPLNVIFKSNLYNSDVSIGQNVDIVGTLKYKTGLGTIFNASLVMSSNTYCFQKMQIVFPEFDSFYRFIQNYGKIPSSLYRILVEVFIVTILQRSLLIIARSQEDISYLIYILSSVFSDKCRVFYPTKAALSSKHVLPSFLSSEHGIVIIPYINVIKAAKKDKFMKTLSQRFVGGHPLNSAIICISNSPTLDYDRTYENSFDLAIRMDAIPQEAIEDFSFGSYPKFHVGDLENRIMKSQYSFSAIEVSEEAQNIMKDYLAHCENENLSMFSPDIIIQMSLALAAFRNDTVVSELDIVMAIYYFEEKVSTIQGNDTYLNQLPQESAFFNPAISLMPSSDECTLYTCWKSMLLANIKGITNKRILNEQESQSDNE